MVEKIKDSSSLFDPFVYLSNRTIAKKVFACFEVLMAPSTIYNRWKTRYTVTYTFPSMVPKYDTQYMDIMVEYALEYLEF